MTDRSDAHGDYNSDAGSTEPKTKEELGYEPCNAVLKYTQSRYGEKRYCTGMAVANFKNANYEHDEYCKHHQQRADLQEHKFEEGETEAFQHGAYVKSYENLYRFLEPHKQVMAIDLYKSLLEESIYAGEWEIDIVVMGVETTETFGGDEAEIYTEFPLATEKSVRAAALWFASLDFIKIQNITEEQFRVAFEETGPRGEKMSVGEDKYEKETESGQKVEIKDEHHLNLPLSRIQKDYERHLKMGGVPLDEGDEKSISIANNRDWVTEIDAPEDVAVASEVLPDEA